MGGRFLDLFWMTILTIFCALTILLLNDNCSNYRINYWVLYPNGPASWRAAFKVELSNADPAAAAAAALWWNEANEVIDGVGGGNNIDAPDDNTPELLVANKLGDEKSIT